MNKVTLSLSLDEAKILYREATLERKSELEEFFPELNPLSIIDKVKDYEDALVVLRRDHFDEKNLYYREIARRKLETIIEALNEGWEPDFNDNKHSKCYYWDYGTSAGLEYSSSLYSSSYAYASFGVRLLLKSKELADYCGNQFKYLYEVMLLR